MCGLLLYDPSGCGAGEVRANVERLARSWKGQVGVRRRGLDAAAELEYVGQSCGFGASVGRY